MKRNAKTTVTGLAIAILAIGVPSTSTAGWWNPVPHAVFHPKFVNPLPQPLRIDATSYGNSLTMEMRQSKQWLGLYDIWGNRVYSDVWGYNQLGSLAQHMGPTIIAKEGVSLDVKWSNKLPDKHLFRVPHHEGAHIANPKKGVPTVTHLHGGHVEDASDGYPTAWFTRDFAEKGQGFNEEKYTYTYENTQEASTLWYHDHALGITRLNVNAGLAGMYLVRDDNELSLDLPSGKYEREILIQDIQVDRHRGQVARLNEFPAYFGNYILVNGMAWPKLNVEPRKYRFRMLNASDSRFYKLSLSRGATFTQIGTEGGLINGPLDLNSFQMAPGERYDMVIDFSKFAGRSIYLKNSASIVDFLPNVNPSTAKLMKFVVGKHVSTPDKPLPSKLRDPIQHLGEPQVTRRLLLGQALDLSSGSINFEKPLIDLLGTVDGGLMRWADPVTEFPKVGDVEVWEIYNTLLVPHPIHVHLVEFEIMNRQSVAMLGYNPVYEGKPTGPSVPILLGGPRAPRVYEQGPKDEVIAYPGEVTRIKMSFDKAGNYVWHCHILTHEDHDMMRPMTVVH